MRVGDKEDKEDKGDKGDKEVGEKLLRFAKFRIPNFPNSSLLAPHPS